jgi:multicomponent Na+:H+ antiporter subunit A
MAFARLQTRVLQNGSVRWYLLATVGTSLAAVAYTLLRQGALPPQPGALDARLHEVALAVLIVVAAAAAVRSRSRFRAIAAMGLVGYGVALVFLLFGAPDLAMTQFAVETLTVIVFVLAFHRLPHYAAHSSRRARAVDLAVCGAAGLLVAALVFASSSADLGGKISSFYADHGVERAHGRNIVNLILVDFRGLDTLGEVTVLAVAAVGVLALLRLRHREGGRP